MTSLEPLARLTYEFPTITHIDDVLPACEGWDELRVSEPQHGYRFITYSHNSGEVFSREHPGWEIRRECRGLAFDGDGWLVSRPFHKFFNMNELDETHEVQIMDAVFSDPRNVRFHWSEKIDGSMVRPIVVDGEVRLATKAGFTEVARVAEEFLDSLADARQIKQFLARAYERGTTPLIEFTSTDPQWQIVIAHEQPGLSLLDVRRNLSGEYEGNIHPDDWDGIDYGLRPNTVYSQDPGRMSAQIQVTREGTTKEGIVFHVGRDHRVKVKSEWYVGLHRIIGHFMPQHIMRAALDGTLDDIMPQLMELGRGKWAVRMFEAFREASKRKQESLQAFAEQIVLKHGWPEAVEKYGWHGVSNQDKHPDIRKIRGMIAGDTIQALPDKADAHYVFGYLENRSIEDMMHARALQSTNSGVSFAEHCKWLGVDTEVEEILRQVGDDVG